MGRLACTLGPGKHRNDSILTTALYPRHREEYRVAMLVSGLDGKG
jgi:hypothetical protein